MPRGSNTEKMLVEMALEKGRLFDCDPNKADRIFVFTRGLVDSDNLKKEIAHQTEIPENLIEDKIYPPWRKLGDGDNEILILLSNPYGGSSDAWELKGTLEHRIYELLKNGVNYLDKKAIGPKRIEDSQKEEPLVDPGLIDDTKVSLGAYYFGKEWVKDELTKIGHELEVPDLQGESRKKMETYKHSLESYLRLDSELPYLKSELERAMRNLKSGKKEEKEIFLNEVHIFTHMHALEKKYRPGQSITEAGSKGPLCKEDIYEILREEGLLSHEQKIVNKIVDERLEQ